MKGNKMALTEYSSTKQILIGLPGTGKTTFISALWHLVESGELPGSLLLKELHGDREYLNRIQGNWLNCEQPVRTLIQDEQIVSMRLLNPTNNSVTEIYLPDLSGETFREQWNDRRWLKEYKALINGASGIILFIHPDEIVEPIRIDDANKLTSVLEDGINNFSNVSENNLDSDDFIEWDSSISPTQVKLVELLQFVHFYDTKNGNKSKKIAIVISAWDLVMIEKLSPRDWLMKRLPLLYQYIIANSNDVPYKIFGISAQGGDLKEHKDKLLGYREQSQRIIVVQDNIQNHDLCAPIAWLME